MFPLFFLTFLPLCIFCIFCIPASGEIKGEATNHTRTRPAELAALVAQRGARNHFQNASFPAFLPPFSMRCQRLDVVGRLLKS